MIQNINYQTVYLKGFNFPSFVKVEIFIICIGPCTIQNYSVSPLQP